MKSGETDGPISGFYWIPDFTRFSIQFRIFHPIPELQLDAKNIFLS